MQAKLEPSEFAFLLHALEAQTVIGVNNYHLFPSDDAIRDSLLEDGFDALKKHGWLIPEERKLRTHSRLMLMTSVMADPEFVITLTRYTLDGDEQKIFYYLAQKIIVEQFYTSDQHYLLTQLDTLSDVIERFQRAFRLPITIEAWATSVTLDIESFEYGMKKAKSGDLADLIKTLHKTNGKSNNINRLVRGISNLQPIGDIEIIALLRGQLQAGRDMVVLRGEDGMVWTMTEDQTTATVSLQPLDQTQFAELIQKILDSMATSRQQAIGVQ